MHVAKNGTFNERGIGLTYSIPNKNIHAPKVGNIEEDDIRRATARNIHGLHSIKRSRNSHNPTLIGWCNQRRRVLPTPPLVPPRFMKIRIVRSCNIEKRSSQYQACHEEEGDADEEEEEDEDEDDSFTIGV